MSVAQATKCGNCEGEALGRGSWDHEIWCSEPEHHRKAKRVQGLVYGAVWNQLDDLDTGVDLPAEVVGRISSACEKAAREVTLDWLREI